jgi:hypothetical protein
LSDIFREVEEEVRRERFENVWKQYGDYIIAGFALVIIAIAGYELWQRYETNQRLKASETLIAAQQLAEAGDFTRATPALAVVAKDAPGGYAQMARLSQAGVLQAAGRRSEAVQIYKAIAAEDSGLIGKVALIRAAWALADTAPRFELETLLAPATDPTSPWRHAAREILAYSDFHSAHFKQAQTEFQALADDKDAPQGMRRRVAAMAAFLKNGGPTTFGTVPPPPPPSAPPGAAPPLPPPTGTPPQ